MTNSLENALNQLDSGLDGRLIRPGDADYDAARALMYGGMEFRPGAIVRVKSAADVSRTVAVAAQTGVELAVPVRAGGSVLGVLEARWENARERELDWVAALADVASLLALFLKRQRAEAGMAKTSAAATARMNRSMPLGGGKT